MVRILRGIMLILYTVGIVWHTVHPLMSILSGRFQSPLTPFIDENAIDPTMFRTPSFPASNHKNKNNNPWILRTRNCTSTTTTTKKKKKNPQLRGGLCGALQRARRSESHNGNKNNNNIPYVPCVSLTSSHRHNNNKKKSNKNNHHPDKKDPFSIDVAHIVPLHAPVIPFQEALVLVLPPCTTTSSQTNHHHQNDLETVVCQENDDDDESLSNHDSSYYYFSCTNVMVEYIHHLAQQPWLAKTIFLVTFSSPTTAATTTTLLSQNQVMTRTVDLFLDSYLGGSSATTTTTANRLPGEFLGALIRQVLVLDVVPISHNSHNNNRNNKTAVPQIIVQPWGHYGIVPNQDLYAALRESIVHTLLGNNHHRHHRPAKSSVPPHVLQVYPYEYHELSQTYRQRIQQVLRLVLPTHYYPLPAWLQRWWDHWFEFATFEWAAATESFPVAPHASALDRGIDALTVQLVFFHKDMMDDDDNTKNNNHDQQSSSTPTLLLLRHLLGSLELTIHSLSNAHERLHHNTNLYTIPRLDGNAYVKHEEFLLPLLLVLVPLVIRAVQLVIPPSTKQQQLILQQQQDERPQHSNNNKNGKSSNGTVVPTTTTTVLYFPLGAVPVVSWAVIGTLLGTVSVALVLGLEWERREGGQRQPQRLDRTTMDRCRVALLYLIIITILVMMRRKNPNRSSPSSSRHVSNDYFYQQQERASIQFVACIVALILHAPMVFGFPALAFPSAVYWTFLIAFPNYSSWVVPDQQSQQQDTTIFQKIKQCLFCSTTWFLCLVTSPFLLVVPFVFATFTLYVQFVYIPLHLLLTMICLSFCHNSNKRNK